jgi:hypothetical protein
MYGIAEDEEMTMDDEEINQDDCWAIVRCVRD